MEGLRGWQVYFVRAQDVVGRWDWESGVAARQLGPRHAQRVVGVTDKRANGRDVLCGAVDEEGRGVGHARSSIEQK